MSGDPLRPDRDAADSEITARLAATGTDADTPIGLHCPECGETPRFLFGGDQAFCGTDGCRILKWDPTQTRAEMLAEGVYEIDLRGEWQ